MGVLSWNARTSPIEMRDLWGRPRFARPVVHVFDCLDTIITQKYSNARVIHLVLYDGKDLWKSAMFEHWNVERLAINDNFSVLGPKLINPESGEQESSSLDWYQLIHLIDPRLWKSPLPFWQPLSREPCFVSADITHDPSKREAHTSRHELRHPQEALKLIERSHKKVHNTREIPEFLRWSDHPG
jgi:hypothetical protein